MDKNNVDTSNPVRVSHIKRKDLPLCCPLPNDPLWDSHPRVYLSIEQAAEKKITCPYCSAVYILDD